MNKSEAVLPGVCDLSGALLMEQVRIKPLTVSQYADISADIYDEIERVVHADMIAAKCTRHPEYGDIILISSPHGGCLMIHLQAAHSPQVFPNDSQLQ
ncbi:MAG: hypothetical protein ACXWF8_09935 [Methylobacter sp.]